LLGCVRDHPPEQPVEGLAAYIQHRGVSGLALGGIRHGVVGCVWTALRTDGLHETPAALQLQRSYAASIGAHLRALTDVDFVVDAFAGTGLRPCFIKGPVLAEAVYRRPDLRSYVDLDVMVEPAGFQSALHALERAGARIYERNWGLVRDRELGELRLIAPSGGVIDLHWHLFNDPRARAEFPVDLDALHERLRPVRVGGTVVHTLDPVDTVLHLALHACLAGAHRLVWLKDVEQALRVDGFNWDELVNRARACRAGLALALVLARAHLLLEVSVPRSVVSQLAPGRWWRAVRSGVDRLDPAARWQGGGSVAQLVARSTRGTAMGSALAASGRAGAWIRHGRRRPTVAELFDASDPRSAAFFDGDMQARASYLDTVTRAGRVKR
jgi:hypothetical protein